MEQLFLPNHDTIIENRLYLHKPTSRYNQQTMLSFNKFRAMSVDDIASYVSLTARSMRSIDRAKSSAEFLLNLTDPETRAKFARSETETVQELKDSFIRHPIIREGEDYVMWTKGTVNNEQYRNTRQQEAIYGPFIYTLNMQISSPDCKVTLLRLDDEQLPRQADIEYLLDMETTSCKHFSFASSQHAYDVFARDLRVIYRALQNKVQLLENDTTIMMDFEAAEMIHQYMKAHPQPALATILLVNDDREKQTSPHQDDTEDSQIEFIRQLDDFIFKKKDEKIH